MELSILIRARNEINTVRVAIERIKKLEKIKYEIIAVDNESKDGTYEYLVKSCNKVLTISNFTHAKSCNLGVRACSGDYIYITNAHSSLIQPAGLKLAIKLMEKNPEVAGCFGRCIPTPKKANLVERINYLYDTLMHPTKIIFIDKYIPGAMQTLCSLYRTDLLKKFKFKEYSPAGGEDALWAHLMTRKGYKLAYVPEISVYHSHGGSNWKSIKRAATFALLSLRLNLFQL